MARGKKPGSRVSAARSRARVATAKVKGQLRPLESLSPAYRKRIERAQKRGLIPPGPRMRGQMAVARGAHPHEGVSRQLSNWAEARSAKNKDFDVDKFMDWAREVGGSRVAEFTRKIDDLRTRAREAKQTKSYTKGQFRAEWYEILDDYEPPDNDFGFFYE
jgi:hypothetical protein